MVEVVRQVEIDVLKLATCIKFVRQVLSQGVGVPGVTEGVMARSLLSQPTCCMCVYIHSVYTYRSSLSQLTCCMCVYIHSFCVRTLCVCKATHG